MKHVLLREGRYYARVVIPTDPAGLRRAIGKTELREPLGADKREAERKSHAVVARMLEEIDTARQRLASEEPPTRQAARGHYARELERDDRMRAEWGNVRMAEHTASFTPHRATLLRLLAAGHLEDDEAEALMGPAADEAKHHGETKAKPGSGERRQLLRDLAGVQLEALATVERRNQGTIELAAPTHPLLADKPAAEPVALSQAAKGRVMGADSLKPLSELLAPFHEERRGRIAKGTADEHRVAVRMLEEFLGEPKAVAAITRQDMLGYKRALMRLPNRYTMRFPDHSLPDAIEANQSRAVPFDPIDASTINDKWLSHIRAVLTWCVDNSIIPDNPASGVKVETGKGHREAPRVAFSPDDLVRIFSPPLFAPDAKYGTLQWALLVLLFTGARSSSEIARIRLADIFDEQGVTVFHLAGASKNEQSKRIVPVHRDLVSLGLLDHVERLRKRGETQLFRDWQPEDKLNRWFLRTYRAKVGITDERKVFHSFRHTLKTALARAGVARDVSDLITGHQDQSVSGIYIHEKQLTMIGAMSEGLNRVEFAAVTKLIEEKRRST